jgi:hypothetical protein
MTTRRLCKRLTWHLCFTAVLLRKSGLSTFAAKAHNAHGTAMKIMRRPEAILLRLQLIPSERLPQHLLPGPSSLIPQMSHMYVWIVSFLMH